MTKRDLGVSSMSPMGLPLWSPSRPILILALLGALLVACSAPSSDSGSAGEASGQSAVEDFYQGKTLRIIVGSAPGGAYDTEARLIARHIGKHIPGSPNVIVENMEGAGHLIAWNYLYGPGPKDGTAIGYLTGAVILNKLTGGEGIEFDPSDFKYLGTPTDKNEFVLVVTKQSGITSFEETLGSDGREIKLAANAPGTGNYTAALLLREVLGANVRLVTGYTGQAQTNLAMEQGEVDGRVGNWEAFKEQKAPEIESGDWFPALQWVDASLPDLPDVPLVTDFADNEEDRELLRLGITVPNQFLRVTIAPPGVPEDRALALETALAETFNDPEFVAEADQINFQLSPLTGTELTGLVTEYMDMPDATSSRLETILRSEG